MEDTYFNDDMILSDKASILIPKDKYLKLLENEESLSLISNMNVFVFEGNFEKAFNNMMNYLGYESFITTTNGYINGENENKMIEVVNNFAYSNNISTERHMYSKERQHDMVKEREQAMKEDLEHLDFILNNVDISEDLKNEIITKAKVRDNTLKDSILNLLNVVGLEKIEMLTQSYNEMKVQEHNMKLKNVKS